jgi:pyruvate kinase
MRLNFSHATVEEADLRIQNLRDSKGRHGEVTNLQDESHPVLRCGSLGHPGKGKNLRAVLLDTQGPEIRTTILSNDHDGKQTVDLKMGDQVNVRSFSQGNDDANMSDDKEIVVTLGEIGKVLGEGKVGCCTEKLYRGREGLELYNIHTCAL